MSFITVHSIIPVRAESSERSEMVTQLLFGDQFDLLESVGSWSKIKSVSDDYEGWIDSKFLLKKLSLFQKKHSYLRSVTGTVQKNDVVIPIVFGSDLTFISQLGFELIEGTEGVFELKNVCEVATLFLGSPYLWGGKTHFGIDCSGFVQQVFKVCGLDLPRDAYQQAALGENVSYDQIEEGDVVFFNGNGKNTVTHVGIALGNHNVIHAHGEVRIDSYTPDSLLNRDTKQKSHLFLYAKRFF